MSKAKKKLVFKNLACKCGQPKFVIPFMELGITDVPVYLDGHLTFDDTLGDSQGWEGSYNEAVCQNCGAKLQVDEDGNPTNVEEQEGVEVVLALKPVKIRMTARELRVFKAGKGLPPSVLTVLHSSVRNRGWKIAA
jgi:hypothetical protein